MITTVAVSSFCRVHQNNEPIHKSSTKPLDIVYAQTVDLVESSLPLQFIYVLILHVKQRLRFHGSVKRYSKIDQHLTRHFKYNSGCLSSPPPFLCSQIITPFLIQWSPPIRKQGCILANCGICIPLFQYYSRISFDLSKDVYIRPNHKTL